MEGVDIFQYGTISIRRGPKYVIITRYINKNEPNGARLWGQQSHHRNPSLI
jgi:hypothetical protein